VKKFIPTLLRIALSSLHVAAWRVFLRDLDSVAGRATSETLTEHHEISAHPSPTILAPDTGGKRVRRTQTGELT